MDCKVFHPLRKRKKKKNLIFFYFVVFITLFSFWCCQFVWFWLIFWNCFIHDLIIIKQNILQSKSNHFKKCYCWFLCSDRLIFRNRSIIFLWWSSVCSDRFFSNTEWRRSWLFIFWNSTIGFLWRLVRSCCCWWFISWNCTVIIFA